MTMREFLKKNKELIERVATSYNCPRPSNYDEREEWVLNDVGLYTLARRSGVKV